MSTPRELLDIAAAYAYARHNGAGEDTESELDALAAEWETALDGYLTGRGQAVTQAPTGVGSAWGDREFGHPGDLD